MGIEEDARSRAWVHVSIVVFTMGVVGVCLAGLGFWLGPADGDLTRIGGLSEREYGWRGAERVPRGVDRSEMSPDELFGRAEPGDVLVFGDSFSMPSKQGTDWTAQLSSSRGLRVRIVRCEDFALAARWASAAGLRRPRAVIVQTAQRYLGLRALKYWRAKEPCAAPGPVMPLVLPRASTGGRSESSLVQRRTGFESVDEVMSRGLTGIRVRLFGGTQSVLVLPLTCDDERPLFSCRRRNQMLVLQEDLANRSTEGLEQAGVAPEDAAERIVCSLRQLWANLDLAGVPVLLLIAPDKSWAYEPWIAESSGDPCIDVFAEVRRALGARVVDILEPLRSAIERGERDIYWPNDTHWGPEGSRIAAEEVVRVLEGRNE